MMRSWRRSWNEGGGKEGGKSCKKVPELVVHERLFEGEQARGEEMKDKQSSSWEEDTQEMIEWRSMRQEEMDQCWKELTDKIEEDVLDKHEVEDSKRGAYRSRGSFS